MVISRAPTRASTLRPASPTGTEYLFWRTVTSALASTRTEEGSVVSNGSSGSARNSGRSLASASPTVSERPVIVRSRSATQPARTSWFSAARSETSGTGTRWRRRNRPTSPSTPPFSCAPSRPARVNAESNM